MMMIIITYQFFILACCLMQLLQEVLMVSHSSLAISSASWKIESCSWKNTKLLSFTFTWVTFLDTRLYSSRSSSR